MKAAQAFIVNVELQRLLENDPKWTPTQILNDKQNGVDLNDTLDSNEHKTDQIQDGDNDNDHGDGGLDINTIPIIFGVDSNSVPIKEKADLFDPAIPEDGGFKSGVYELMTTSLLERDHFHHPVGRQTTMRLMMNAGKKTKDEKVANEKKGDELQLPDWKIKMQWRSVYSTVNRNNGCKEPAFTNKIDKFCGTLDYLFISNGCRGIVRFLEMPWQRHLKYHRLLQSDQADDHENNEDAADGNVSSTEWIQLELEREKEICRKWSFLPNKDTPSDHLPLCADILI